MHPADIKPIKNGATKPSTRENGPTANFRSWGGPSFEFFDFGNDGQFDDEEVYDVFSPSSLVVIRARLFGSFYAFRGCDIDIEGTASLVPIIRWFVLVCACAGAITRFFFRCLRTCRVGTYQFNFLVDISLQFTFEFFYLFLAIIGLNKTFFYVY